MTKIEKLQTIQVSNLPQLISNIVGYNVEINHIKVSTNGNGYISFDSNSLIDYTGIMKPFYERFQISSFSNGFTTGDKEYYWVIVNFSFTYKSGGSNGSTITTVFYDFENHTWFIQPKI